MAWLAAREALHQASLKEVAATGLTGSIGWPEQSSHSTYPCHPHQGLDWLAGQLQLTGLRRLCLSACAASTQAVGDAMRWIRLGRVSSCLVVGSDTRLHPAGMMGYFKLGTLETRFHLQPTAASRPFSKDRGGFVIGEGAAALVLEREDLALQRGAKPLARLTGFAATNDAFRLTDPEPGGSSLSRCLSMALDDASISPDKVNYLNLHGTGTAANDTAEISALRQVFGPILSRIPAGSFKSMIGHLAMAAGAIEITGSILALQHQHLPPNLNLEIPDPDCHGPFWIQHPGLQGKFQRTLKCSAGLGGQNAALVIETPAS